MRFATRSVAVVVVVAGLSGCGSRGSPTPGSGAPVPNAKAVSWPLPADPMALVRNAGLIPQKKESFEYHVHAHLDVFVNGHPVTVPGGIGIDITDPEVHKFVALGEPGYGGINNPCAQPCISPLHTHDATGVVHIEAPLSQSQTLFTLGRFFKEWGLRLDATCVDRFCRPRATMAFYVDGKRATGDPGKLLLSDHVEIAVVIGSPPSRIPASYAFDPSEP